MLATPDLLLFTSQPIVPLTGTSEVKRPSALCAVLYEEGFLARDVFCLAMHGYHAPIAIEVARLAASQARSGTVTPLPADPIVEELRRLMEQFRQQRPMLFCARP